MENDSKPVLDEIAEHAARIVALASKKTAIVPVPAAMMNKSKLPTTLAGILNLLFVLGYLIVEMAKRFWPH